ncbi:cytochrome-c oxidase, cbb3-type subunit II [Sphingomicrobium aestuariivivum]|uniref:cytochrome-c oxidase, cbb3-type subunit II n=1 Tax=Sphingomicrobium aestuariivivum TaxID=1582356 RepID=UPI001FD6CF40|nr:cytochrome-c oxidase, cbb3-type subunit II [Sphingomicrobium aestuariivivum]MCJ8191291.1 cytochrome-c oxidase, cbb3-type subunit II [Sphingomicrobium aestuariivivum]
MGKIVEQHKKIEKNVTLLAAGALVTVLIGGIVEIAPLFYLDSTIEDVEGIRPLAPLELAGRNIYIREGCNTCHSQMIRPFRDEVERYGHYSLAAESKYDHPFLWGSKRTGPDLARVGGRYSDEWHVQHLADPQSVVPESIMPQYGFLRDKVLDPKSIEGHLEANAAVGVPYGEEHLANAVADLRAQATGRGDVAGLTTRYPDAEARDYDLQPSVITEMDALVAYLQQLGTHIDFSEVEAQEVER